MNFSSLKSEERSNSLTFLSNKDFNEIEKSLKPTDFLDLLLKTMSNS